MNAKTGDLRFRAFISYSHADQRWASWLHRSLETWRPPPHLAGRGKHGAIQRLAPVFLDRDELASATDLGRTVNEALAQSANLIVVCSPHAAASRWVDEEVRTFKRLGRSERIFCLIVAGEPGISAGPGPVAEECFCPALRMQPDTSGDRAGQPVEPIAADVRPGMDGKANAKLKLIAGLLDISLDTLKQRELQRHNRRLAWIAGAGFAGMATLAVLAGAALHERNKALFQREQAKSLIGFMVGDLRGKLEPVDRLDILDGVANHATAYFEAQQDAGDVASRNLRAKAFLLLGGVRLDQGKIDEATRAFKSSLGISQSLYTHGQRTPAISLNLIDSQFWLGMAAWKSGNVDEALMRFQAAMPVLDTLLANHPHNHDALQHQVWMLQNIGHIYQARNMGRQAMLQFRAQLAASVKLVDTDPDNRKFRFELAHANNNIAALLFSQGDLTGAEQHYRAEKGILSKLVQQDPGDSGASSSLAIAQSFLARVATALGHEDQASDSLRTAMKIGEAAVATDPDNSDKAGDLAAYCRNLGRMSRLSGDTDKADFLLSRAHSLYARMLASAPANMRARYGLASTELEQARLALNKGDSASAHKLNASARRNFKSLLQAQNYAYDAALGLANASLLLGKLHIASKEVSSARIEWTNALASLHIPDDKSHDPDQLNVRAELLTLLGRADEAKPLLERLDAMHYRERSYLDWRYRDGARESRSPAAAAALPERAHRNPAIDGKACGRSGRVRGSSRWPAKSKR